MNDPVQAGGFKKTLIAKRDAVFAALKQAGITNPEALFTIKDGESLTPAQSKLRAITHAALSVTKPGERPKLPKGAQWVRHERAGSKAAQRRLRQMEKGRIAAGQSRCDTCGTWVHGTLGGHHDEQSGKFACFGCAAAYLTNR